MVGIIFVGDIYACPYLATYTEMCEADHIEYEVLFWNRSGENICLPDNYLYFDYRSNLRQSKYGKALDFFKFRLWLCRKIKRKKYDKLIILSTLSGMLLPDILYIYRGKYIFDIRDYSYENSKVFYRVESRLIKGSYFTCISSPGFRRFLPEYDYIIAHNIQSGMFGTNSQFRKKEYGEKLNVVWNGVMRYFSYQSKIIEKLKNDPRFEMIYYGAGPDLEKYKQFCHDKSILNVEFMGKYQNRDKEAILETADILNNAYWTSKQNEVQYAISNKFYDGLAYKIPQLVESNTYKTSLCLNAEIGMEFVSEEADFADRLYDWYFAINADKFSRTCDNLLHEIKKEEVSYKSSIRDFLLL